MWVVMGFFLTAIIGLVAVLGVGRRGLAQTNRNPWILYDTAKMHAGITAGLAGFALTGVVLVVTLAHDRPAITGSPLDTVIVMFLVAYIWLIGNAFLVSYIMDNKTSGELVPRVHFGLAATIEYRTVFLSWFALLPLLEANGLGHLSYVLYFLLPASLLCGAVLIAMAADSLGLLRIWETFFFGDHRLDSRTGLRRYRYIRSPRRSITVFHAESHACPLLHQRLGLLDRGTHASFTTISAGQTILQEIRQADRHCRHAIDNDLARIPLAWCRRGHLNCSCEAVCIQ